MASKTRRQGQSRGQSAPLLHSADLLDPEVLDVLRREVASGVDMWSRLAPDAANQLIFFCATAKALGGTDADVLTLLAEHIENLAHPRNQNFAKTRTAFDCVETDLRVAVMRKNDADAARGRRALIGGRKRREGQAQKQRDTWRHWQAIADSLPRGRNRGKGWAVREIRARLHEEGVTPLPGESTIAARVTYPQK